MILPSGQSPSGQLPSGLSPLGIILLPRRLRETNKQTSIGEACGDSRRSAESGSVLCALGICAVVDSASPRE